MTTLGDAIILQSGNKLRIQKTNLDNATALLDTLIDKFSKAFGGTAAKEGHNGEVIEAILNGVSSVATDKKMRDQIIACFQGCTYNDESLSKETFNNVSARADFLEVLILVARANVEDFLPPTLGVMLKARVGDLVKKYQGYTSKIM